ncbi:hypothetical protein EI94DRAFT_1762214 [Lactarius quietus]|nr:hypothetical protein EI94DRAFT_1762214 [Lactarius quietus]
MQGEKETHTGAHFWLIKAQNKNLSQYPLALKKMVENRYPVPSYLADVFQKPEGWMKTPQVHLRRLT